MKIWSAQVLDDQIESFAPKITWPANFRLCGAHPMCLFTV